MAEGIVIESKPWWRSRSWADEGCVYFVWAPEVSRVKIGHSTVHPSARLCALKTGSPCELLPAGILFGPLEDEGEIHRRFDDYRVRGEWFNIGVDIWDLMETGLHPWPEPMPDYEQVVAARAGRELDPCSFVEAVLLSGQPPHILRRRWPTFAKDVEWRVPIQWLAEAHPPVRRYLMQTHRPPARYREVPDEVLVAWATEVAEAIWGDP